MTNASPGSQSAVRDLPCPFCSLVCDDLAADVGEALHNACDLARRGFSTGPDVDCRIDGRRATRDEAMAAATELLAAAHTPLVAGLAVDVEGMRAALEYAERRDGVLDHMDGAGIDAAVRLTQQRGYVRTTQSEVRNRADVVVVLGAETLTDFPRFIDRVLAPAETLDAGLEGSRRVFLVARPRSLVGLKVPGAGVEFVRHDPARMAETVLGLSALVAGRPMPARIGGARAAELARVAEALLGARYAAFVYSGRGLGPALQDLSMEAVSDMLRALTAGGRRAAALPLVGSRGGATALAVCTWTTGFPLRVHFRAGRPHYDPRRNDWRRRLATGDCDLLLWLDALTDVPPPDSGRLPTIVLGRRNNPVAPARGVYIPVGTPGLDHGGRLVRGDNVVSLRLRPLKETALPSIAHTLGALTTGLPSRVPGR